jgi:GTP cyclohydrolase II
MNIEVSEIANLPTKFGSFKIKVYKDGIQEHLLIMSEGFEEIEAPYLRIHSECLTGDTLGSLKCDCQNQLHESLKFIGNNGGMIIYHRQEGRNIGLLNKVNAYALQDQGYNTVEANLKLGFKEDERDYRAITYILKDLGLKKIKLITNNPTKIDFVTKSGVEILERVPMITCTNPHNEKYLNVKKDQMGHLL